MSDNDFLHKQHRERMKYRFMHEGLDSFEPHNVLELLLFYSIPRKDTNEISHRLLRRFGSLRGVFDAPAEQLTEVDGISEHSATLIKLIPSLARRYAMDDVGSDVRFTTYGDVGKYLVSRYVGITKETVLLMLLDSKGKLIECIKVHEGSINSATLTPRTLVETALLKGAAAVVVSHNHPGGLAIPSSDDLRTTEIIKNAFMSLEIKLLGHFIVAGNSYCNICDPGKKICTVGKESSK